MSEYSFNKAVTMERLVIILKGATFWSAIDGMRVDHGNEIKFTTNRELSAGELAELDSIVNSYSDFDLSIVYDDILDEVAKFSHTIKKHFGKKNMLRGYTAQQVDTFITDLGKTMTYIDSYALTTAIGYIQTLPATDVLLQEDIDEAVAMIGAKLMEL